MTKPKDPQPILIRRPDVPARYGFSERQIKRWIHERKLRVVKPSGKTGPCYLRTADLDALIEASTIPARKTSKST